MLLDEGWKLCKVCSVAEHWNKAEVLPLVCIAH